MQWGSPWWWRFCSLMALWWQKIGHGIRWQDIESVECAWSKTHRVRFNWNWLSCREYFLFNLNCSISLFLRTVTFGDTSIDDQQLGVVWLKNVIISCSLSGFINYVDPETMSLKKVLKGHNKSIMSLAIDDKKEYAFTGDFEGNISYLKLF